MILAVVAVANFAQADHAGHILKLSIAIRAAGEAIERMVGNVQLHHALRQKPMQLRRRGVNLHSRFGQGGARRRRAAAPLDFHQAINGRSRAASMLSVAHSLGTLTPASAAARITDVPAGTVTDLPSICRVTKPNAAPVSATRAGDSVVGFLDQCHEEVSCALLVWKLLVVRWGCAKGGAGFQAKSSGKWRIALCTG